MAYIYPSAVHGVSDSFQDHVNRGSVNPGVDYVDAYGDTVVSVAAGTVTDASSSNGGGGGRTIHVDHDDGSGADYLHLSQVGVSAGQWVAQGQTLGHSGASGYGDDWYYGAHLHISFRYNHSHGYSNNGNQDFHAIMATQQPPTPPRKPDLMKKYHYEDRRTRTLAPGQVTYLTDPSNHGKNVVGGVGPYSITAHFGSSGMAEGDGVQLALLWDDNKGKQSFHYKEYLTADRDGEIAASIEFKRNVDPGFSVFLWVKADEGNTAPLQIDWIDSDAYLFST
jgi:murein DD-endopeptidase MepM/ murein hydrolase activator NlpD